MKTNRRGSAHLQSYGIFLFAGLTLSSHCLAAQVDSAGNDPGALRAVSPVAMLPDAPGLPSPPQPLDNAAEDPPPANTPKLAPHFAKYIEPGETAVKLTGFDKVLLGVRHATSLYAAATWFLSAGYEQLLDSRPNYGQTFKGYTQRLGAASARNVSEGVFSDSVLAPLLHEDTRYYKLGPGHPFSQRLVHALVQPIVTRSDSGARTINFADIGGNLGGAVLTDAYYPPINRTAGATLVTFGTSMGGGAIGYLFNEFFSIRLPVSR